jgi:transposase
MDKIDIRRVPRGGQQVLRRQVIAARQAGVPYWAIQERYGACLGTACAWWQRYQAQGEAFFDADGRGRPRGSGRRLNGQQSAHIQQLIRNWLPDQLQLPFALWTRHAAQRLIEAEYDVLLPIRTVGEYLKRWGYTPQRPAKRAYEQNPKAVDQWLNETYPAIAARAQDEGAEIHWGDETGLRSDHQAGRGYAPAGRTPVAHVPAQRVRVQMISTVTNRGQLRFMHYTGAMNSRRLIGFFKRLIRTANRKVFVILDNLKVHHSKPVKNWLAQHPDAIEVFYLPAYTPERNPDEYLNGDLKRSIHSDMPARGEAEMRRKTMSRLRSIQKRPAHVRSYFKNAFVKYAA